MDDCKDSYLVPTGDDSVWHAVEIVVRFEELFKQPQAGAAGGDGKLGIQRQHHQFLYSVLLDLEDGLLRERLPVSAKSVQRIRL